LAQLPSPPAICPPAGAGSLSDIETIKYKGPRLNKAVLVSKFPRSKVSKRAIGLSDITSALPTNFNWRDNQYVNIESPRDQGQCGSCWAFSSSTCLGDRYAVKFTPEGKLRGDNLATSTVKGCKAPKPSVVWTLSCASPNSDTDNGCNGGLPSDACEFFGNTGNKLETCWPYSIVQNDGWTSVPCLNQLSDNCCNSCCNDDRSKNKFYTVRLPNGEFYDVLWHSKVDGQISSSNDVDLEGSILNIKREIYSKGPVISSFAVYNDFMGFWETKASDPDQVYMPNASSGFEGGHAIVIVGWGVNSKGIKYWLIRNSWGTDGADGGYFKMAQSDQINQSNWNGIDVPIIMDGNSIMGGAITFDIPDTVNFTPEPFMDPNPIDNSNSSPAKNFFNSVSKTIKNNKVLFSLILAIILVLIFLKIFFLKKK
ncbi:MAG: hypothetical protein EB127_25990, partial [Alphaproteobacteria bacterium]|nr:hypothetical protein [Alphaproteobacteria bacterium]